MIVEQHETLQYSARYFSTQNMTSTNYVSQT